MGRIARKGILYLSKSVLQTYLHCPRQAYYEYEADGIPRKTDYDRLCGSEVHRHIQQLYKPPKDPRPFFYKTKGSAVRAWFSRWKRALAENAQKLRAPNADTAEKFRKVGAHCVAMYWEANVDEPPPLAIERRYECEFRTGVRLVGVFDQIRAVPLTWVAIHRPDLVQNGQLIPGYAPVIIVDLKTDYLSYDARQFGTEPTLQEEVGLQYALHENLQATLYTRLYEEVMGRKPVGFLWYHLRSGKAFFTYREGRDYANLDETVYFVLGNLAVLAFPKNPGRHCARCDYLAPCREDRNFLVVEAEDLRTAGAVRMVPTDVVQGEHQLQLGLRVPRSIRPLPVPPPLEQRVTILRSLPWNNPRREVTIGETVAQAAEETPEKEPATDAVA